MYSIGENKLLVGEYQIKHFIDGEPYLDAFPGTWTGARIYVAHTDKRYVVYRVDTDGFFWLRELADDE